MPGDASGLTSGTSYGSSHFYKVDNRSWGDSKKLDLIAHPEGYLIWRDRAMGQLAKDRPDIKDLLLWAEREVSEITRSREEDGVRYKGLAEGISETARVSGVFFEGIKYIGADSLLSRARNCEGHGLELWRMLRTSWLGQTSQVRSAKSKQYQEPERCADKLELFNKLPAWKSRGAEIQVETFTLPVWVQENALAKFVPFDHGQRFGGSH